MKYDDITIQKLRDLAIFDVCSKLGITLYGMGQLTKRAKCWYHDDQHPSMHVNKKKNIYKCFVCGKGGDVIRLVMDYENLTFPEACDWLVREFNVVVTTTNPTNIAPGIIAAPRLAGSSKSAGQKDSSNSSNSSTKDRSVALQSCSEEPSVESVRSVCPLHPDFVKKSLGVNSEFCQALVSAGYMTQQQMQYAAERYRLGMTKDGSVIFWEIDQQGHCHNGKLMHYLPDCHRDKSRTPTWAAAELKKSGTLPPDFENPHCLFGLHLLNSKAYKGVAIVESEKTAIIFSQLFPDFLWLSCGGLQMFKPELLAPLVAHKVILFPDTDEKGEAFKSWTTVAQQATKLYQFQYPLRVSPLLELHATPSQKQRKIDIVDFLFEAESK